jgi:plastocyanin
MKKGIATIFLFAGLFLSFTVQVRADATVYWDFDNGFSPSTVVIGPGEKVTWWNVDPYGFDVLITFSSSFSFTLRNLHGQAVTFPSQPGTYNYQSDWGNYGAVIVNVPPSVTITNPPNNAVLSAPATFNLQATASDTADDYVSDVQFYLGTSDGTNALEDVFTAPYSTTVTDLPAGTYFLIAVTTDSRGAQATNAITITVGSVGPVTLAAPRISAGQFLFNVTGLTTGKTNLLQTSTNLLSWKSANTNIAASASMTVTNVPSSGPHYFRILQLP